MLCVCPGMPALSWTSARVASSAPTPRKMPAPCASSAGGVARAGHRSTGRCNGRRRGAQAAEFQLLGAANCSGYHFLLPPRLATSHNANTTTIVGNSKHGGGAQQEQADAQQGAKAGASVAQPCAEEAGGCIAPWNDDNFWTRSTFTVRTQLLEQDPGLNQNLISSGTTVAQIFNQDAWERHRAIGRYWINMRRLVYSTVMRRILRPCCVFAAIAAAVGAANTMLLPAAWPAASSIGMPIIPHTLLGAALSLLLVFRTNASYARFVEGRMLWGALVRYARDWSRLSANWFPTAELRGRAARYVQVLAFVLKSHLRAGRSRPDPADPSSFKDDPSNVVRELLPCCEATELLQQPNKPYFMLCRMTALVRDAASQGVPYHVLLQLEHTLSELLGVVGGCDRILGTPIPLSYTRHTSRSLVLYLATLPLALWPIVGWLAVPVMACIAFIFLGIDEIGVEIEEPFCILPLHPLCKTVVADVKTAMRTAAHA